MPPEHQEKNYEGWEKVHSDEDAERGDTEIRVERHSDKDNITDDGIAVRLYSYNVSRLNPAENRVIFDWEGKQWIPIESKEEKEELIEKLSDIEVQDA